MRLGRDVQFEQGVFLSVIHLDGFACIDRRPGNELETAGHVEEHDVSVIGMDISFHGVGTVGTVKSVDRVLLNLQVC